MSYFYVVVLFIILPMSVLAEELDKCGNNAEAKALVKLIKEDEGQRRTSLRCNQLLTDVAEAKAKAMSERGLVSHNLEGSPNLRLRNANYKLPSYYGVNFNSNQVEAIAGGYSTAVDVWDAFKKSEKHRAHLLGEIEFYKEQDEIGAAFIEKWKSPHVEYWVVYLTKGYRKNQTKSDKITEIPNKNLFILEVEKK
ncbi:hypothetical protein GCM10008107_11320 [Psychrosphaera saromensis]|nr:CAP domain-containing protein [Psychrosphaera saromensis]GHB63933.1 hypothetical protein GCM10008107_11320 [Psychrosphaera saromensis]GLQ15635.1 hypothetical protein GCM10007917_30900 [Psychrosphaera saromensis]